MKLLICSMLLTLTLSAANITGKWQGTASYVSAGKRTTTGIYLDLTQTGPKLTGTANEPAGNKNTPAIIQAGTVQGKAISFEATINDTPETFQLNLVTGNQISGKMVGGGKTVTVQLRLEKKP